MKTIKWLLGRPARQRGAAVTLVVVLLAIGAASVGSLTTAQLTYLKNAESSYSHERAFYLADAGLRAALARALGGTNPVISMADSRGFFSQTNAFEAADWGFQTTTNLLNGNLIHIVSTGRYRGQTAVVEGNLGRDSETNNIHAMYKFTLYAGNSGGATNYTLSIGGTGSGADFVMGDTYSGMHLLRSGDAFLRLPEYLVDLNGDRLWSTNETWTNAYTMGYFTQALTQAQFDTYVAALGANISNAYGNGRYDFGEPYVDTIGNGQYDIGETFNDVNNNGVRDTGDSFIDRNGNGRYDAGTDTVVDMGNGQWDPGEQWVEDSTQSLRRNGVYDPAGGYWQSGVWKTTYKSGKKTYSCASWPAESYEDLGDGNYQPSEAYVDQNGVYDVGEQYVDDRNEIYDYGTMAYGNIAGMPAPTNGQRAATGGDILISPPDLARMYYNLTRTNTPTPPVDALPRWGNNVIVNAAKYGSAVAITDTNKPEHIFVRNPPRSGSTSSGGETIYGRSYTYVTNNLGQRVDDYFFEDPSDSTYNSSVSSASIDGTTYTAPMYVTVRSNHNDLVYYVDGNVYIHHPQVYSLRFRNPGTRVTIVASGNITISDEFYYNADYDPDLERDDVNSRIVDNPKDALCLIALKNTNTANSGNIFIGDAQFGTGGSIHAMLYAENDFIDNNINGTGQEFISVFGNMAAGNQIRLIRTGTNRTRLDVSLDTRIRDGLLTMPGLPMPQAFQLQIERLSDWAFQRGSWRSNSRL